MPSEAVVNVLSSSYFVTFDLWQTLIFDDPELDRKRAQMRCEGLREVLSSRGLSLSLDALLEAHEESAPRFQAIWRRNQHISTIDQIRLIVQIASGNGIDLPRDSSVIKMLERAYIEPLFTCPPTLNEDALVTLEGMRDRVRKVGLISNTGRAPGVALRELLQKLGILRFFDATVFSDEARCRKPDKRIFDLAASELGAELRNTIHVGDNPEADVWGAKQAGMRTVLFDYPIPEVFKQQEYSLFRLSRTDRQVPDSEIKPDARITSLRDVLLFVDSLA
jgi:putative hydrolase of the HAD superfamily